jgi:hypothetical protein
LIQALLRSLAQEGQPESGVETQLVFDTERDHYQLWQVGWQGEHRIRGCVVQIDLKDGRIWVQYDGTETGLVPELLKAGVPKEDIVLAFHAPSRRQHSGFAVA